MKVKSESEVTQSCPTLHDTVDCGLPGSSIHGMFQARVLEWVSISFSNLDSILKSRHYFANKGPSSQSYGLSSSHVCMWELYHKESWLPENWCFWTVVLEKILESPLDCKEIQPVHPKGNQFWIFIGRTDVAAQTWATCCEELTPWKRPWCWERLKAGGEGDDREWDGWMASPTRWTWVWASSRSWWWTGKPGVLQSMGSQRVGQYWATELKWIIRIKNLIRCSTQNLLKIAFVTHKWPGLPW